MLPLCQNLFEVWWGKYQCWNQMDVPCMFFYEIILILEQSSLACNCYPPLTLCFSGHSNQYDFVLIFVNTLFAEWTSGLFNGARNFLVDSMISIECVWCKLIIRIETLNSGLLYNVSFYVCIGLITESSLQRIQVHEISWKDIISWLSLLSTVIVWCHHCLWVL